MCQWDSCPDNIYPKSPLETLEKGVKYVFKEKILIALIIICLLIFRDAQGL